MQLIDARITPAANGYIVMRTYSDGEREIVEYYVQQTKDYQLAECIGAVVSYRPEEGKKEELIPEPLDDEEEEEPEPPKPVVREHVPAKKKTHHVEDV